MQPTEISVAADRASLAITWPDGVYAINITFSDGYAKGIYPWDMLRGAIGAPAVQGLATAQTEAISGLGN